LTTPDLLASTGPLYRFNTHLSVQPPHTLQDHDCDMGCAPQLHIRRIRSRSWR